MRGLSGGALGNRDKERRRDQGRRQEQSLGLQMLGQYLTGEEEVERGENREHREAKRKQGLAAGW